MQPIYLSSRERDTVVAALTLWTSTMPKEIAAKDAALGTEVERLAAGAHNAPLIGEEVDGVIERLGRIIVP
jgi:hypothetical protein